MEDHSLGRIVSVLISPAKTFRSIAERPTWLVGLLVIILFSLGSLLIALPKIDWEESMRAELAKSGRELSGQEMEQMEGQIEVMEKFGTTMIVVAGVVFPWIIYPLMAAIFLGLFRVLGSEMGFKTSLSVTVYGLMPWLVATVLSVPVFLSLEELTTKQLETGVLTSNLGVLAGEDTGAVLSTFLAGIDFFSLWTVVLLTIGYSIAAKVPKGRAAAVVIVVWLVYLAGKAGLAGLGQMFT